MRKSKFFILLLSLVLIFSMIGPNFASAKEPAKLVWKTKRFGNDLVVSMTNIHEGWAGPKFPKDTTKHVNVHLDQLNSYNNRVKKKIANWHVVKYKKSSKTCIYIYETEKRKTIMDACADDWSTIAKKASNAMKSSAKNWVSPMDSFALVPAFILVTAALYTFIMGWGRYVVASTEEEVIYSEAEFISEQQPFNDSTIYNPSEDETDGLYDDPNIALEDDLSTLEVLPISSYIEDVITSYSSPANDTVYVTTNIGGNNSSLIGLTASYPPRFTIQNSVGTIVKTGSLNSWTSNSLLSYDYSFKSTTNISTAGLPAGHYRIKVIIFSTITDSNFSVLTRHYYINTNRTINQFSN